LKTYLSDIHFEILGVSRQCSKDQIKKAFREQSMLWHPDKFSDNKEQWNEAHVRFIKIIEAYELLENYEPPKPKPKPTQKSEEKNFNAAQAKTKVRTNINRIRVKSSNVFAIGYDKINKVLQVEFKKGSIYEYYDVSEEIYFAFMNAESKGRFMGNLYKYKYRQV
jgi:curved DNA-binding protein CbpA